MLHDPFGWAVLTQDAHYAGPNRFFAHASLGWYWKHVPLWLHTVASPISSLYAASALFTAVLQVCIVLGLAAYVYWGGGRVRGGYWLAVILLLPLFQTDGFYEQLGIVNWATTYTFFYTLPTAWLLLLLWPFFAASVRAAPLRVAWWQAALLLGLMVVVSFNGPVGTAAAAVVVASIGLHWAWQQSQAAHTWPLAGSRLAMGWLSGQALFLLGVLAFLSLYSVFIGRNNAENSHTHTLSELYQLLPIGIAKEITMQPGLPLLLGMLLLNLLLLRQLPSSAEHTRVLAHLRWTGWFATIFLLLLPLGGYRSYRPYLVRGDSIQPVLIGVFYAYGVSTYLLLQQLRGRWRPAYVGAVLALGAAFTYANFTWHMPRTNECERWSLDQLARAPESEVRLSPYCPVLQWDNQSDPHLTELHGLMLQYWGITDRPKLYYH
ncbi:hypothetical protein HHL22_17565 [Hymenobacter sp. RP-2-7]|uniref:Glycosyltransferase RgtA/B/C/D-like domain-containing protein n=1 Tax=Hymenobacter polaris TaxID=2682546 RepID=A0A7Y0FNL0_9BACT|nr:hypothetical protein [Hymenobacter polaris]NML67018.1 hypothetical protein [Hymenobacter polaris]